jgi:hypothetical protein
VSDTVWRRGRPLKWLALILGATAFGYSAIAAGIASHSYTCADLHRLIAAKGFVFISSPDFGDFVVADLSFCGSGGHLQLRGVATIDRAECLVNYCLPAAGSGGGGGSGGM